MSDQPKDTRCNSNNSKNGTPYPKETLAQTPPRVLKEEGNEFAGGLLSSLMPGVVEVQFLPGLRPRLDDSSPELAPGFRSDVSESQFSLEYVNESLTGINSVLQDQRLMRAEATFRTPPYMAYDSWLSASQRGVEIPDLSGYYTLYFPEELDARGIARELNKNPLIQRAAPVPFTMPASTGLHDPLVGFGDRLMKVKGGELETQWYVFRCRVDRVWKMGFTGKGVVIADVDWGFLTSHLDLRDRLRLERAYNAIDESTNVCQGTIINHGTAVMGLLGAGANDFGMQGFAPEAELWPIQVNNGSSRDIVPTAWSRAIEHVINTKSDKPRVLLVEGQTTAGFNIEGIDSIHAAIRYAIANKMVVCVPAGNGNVDAGEMDPFINENPTQIMPTGSIIVGATKFEAGVNCREEHSNFGETVAVSAPGDRLHDLTCSDEGETCYRNGFGGTSGATAKVTGAVALLLEINPSLTNDDLREIFKRTGSEIVTDPTKPIGKFLDCEKAALAARESKP